MLTKVALDGGEFAAPRPSFYKNPVVKKIIKP
jgi:hypothetical protein